MSKQHRGPQAVCLLCVAALADPSTATAQEARELPPIIVESEEPGASLSQTRLSDDDLSTGAVSSPDGISLLRGRPGFSAYANGGISSLPVLRGLADDRVLTTIDGATLSSFCPNHMNPPGSYALSSRLRSITMTPTLSRVSAGGDNIAGVIAIETAKPTFTEDGFDVSGQAGGAYRSVADAWTSDFSGTLAGEQFSLGYDASYAFAENYKRGNGERVRSTQFEAYDQAVTLGARSGQGDLFTLKIGRAFVPYEGFPTQRMDLTENDSTFVNAVYERAFAWGDFRAAINWRSVDHEMNFLDDKGGSAGADMPMISKGDDYDGHVSFKTPVEGLGMVGGGVEIFRTRLDDYWPPVAGSMMMGPDTYININDGERDRYAIWGEWTAQLAAAWTTSAGLRYERVETDAGDVQPYGTGMLHAADIAAAADFNARSHDRADDNVDVTLAALWRPTDSQAYEIGVSRKTRSPNLYERYTWGMGAMSSAMTSFAGDANSYVGNIDLKPEIAHSLAVTAQFTDGPSERHSLKISVYRTWVTDYIDADKLADLAHGFVRLQFANHDVTLYGVEVSGRTEIWEAAAWGTGTLTGALSYTRGENEDTGDDLYHIAPVTARLALEHSLAGWTSSVELEVSGEKDHVNALRHEPETAAYALLNLRTSTDVGPVRIDLGIENLFDTDYDLPLGGVAYGDYKLGGSVGTIQPLPGPGRSFNVALSVAF